MCIWCVIFGFSFQFTHQDWHGKNLGLICPHFIHRPLFHKVKQGTQFIRLLSKYKDTWVRKDYDPIQEIGEVAEHTDYMCAVLCQMLFSHVRNST